MQLLIKADFGEDEKAQQRIGWIIIGILDDV